MADYISEFIKIKICIKIYKKDTNTNVIQLFEVKKRGKNNNSSEI